MLHNNIVYIRLFAFALFFLFSIISVAQDNGIDTDISPAKMKDRARHAFKTGDVYTALFYYEEIVKRDSSYPEALYQLAEMQRYSRNYEAAEQTYSKVYERYPARYPLTLYYKGLMQKMSGNYEEAKKNMLKFRKESAGNMKEKNFASLLNKEIAGCDSGITYRDFPNNIKLKNAGSSVNYPHVEFSPLLLDSSTMLFGSLRLNSLAFYDVSDGQYETQPTRQIYKAEKKGATWEETGLYEVFNEPGTDMGNFAYSVSSGKYYFSKCSKDLETGKVICKIYSTEQVNGKWSSPVALPHPINLDGYTTTQPAIVLDSVTINVPVKPTSKPTKGKADPKSKTTSSKKKTSNKPAQEQKSVAVEYLYFVSDRPGGKGGTDIWYTSYNNSKKQWSEPTNLSSVNTSEVECTPFYHFPSQTLYFSSSGYTNAGGLDVFKMKRTEKRFSKPENLGFPINSSCDDVGFTLNEKGDKGFVVSNRPGGTPFFHETCCDDIFEFEILPVKPFVCNLDLNIVEADTTGCMPNQVLNIVSYNTQTKEKSSDKATVNDCIYKTPLKKHYIYKFFINREGYSIDTLTVETRNMCSAEIIEKKLSMNKSKKDISSMMAVKPTEGKAFVLKELQYEVDKADLTSESKVVLDSVLIPFLKEHPDDKLVINSHTDDQGSHKYNHKLSQLRADNVVKYLVSQGIDIGRLRAKGHGETQPLVPNQNPDGTDNPIGRAINRRTEFLLEKAK